MKRILSVLVLISLLFVSCGNEKKQTTELPEGPIVTDKTISEKINKESLGEEMYNKASTNLLAFSPMREGEEIAVMETSLGTIKIRLFDSVAPKAAENFREHCRNGYYEGIIFHRVIKDFMIQGGDPTGTGTGGESIWGKDFVDEFDMKALNFTGSISMANSGSNTNGSQFFINNCPSISSSILSQLKTNGWPEEAVAVYEKIGGNPHLDGRHTVFGYVIEGMDVVDKISKVETSNDRPIENVTIIKTSVEKFSSQQ